MPSARSRTHAPRATERAVIIVKWARKKAVTSAWVAQGQTINKTSLKKITQHINRRREGAFPCCISSGQRSPTTGLLVQGVMFRVRETGTLCPNCRGAFSQGEASFYWPITASKGRRLGSPRCTAAIILCSESRL